MTPLCWPCPLPGGGDSAEYALAFDRKRAWRLLIVPALLEEANRLRRLTVETMRRLDGAGIDSFLPDLPGLNESPQQLEVQSADDWQDAMTAAARHFGATHVLGMRGGALFLSAGLPAWRYAPVNGTAILRQLLRARILAAREAGRDETQERLLELGLRDGLVLSGYPLSADFIGQFQSLAVRQGPGDRTIDQDMLGGSGLWLRAEPDEDPKQADALAAILAIGIKA